MAIEIVATGIDTVIVNVKLLGLEGQCQQRPELSGSLLAQLEEWQLQAQEANECIPTSFSFHGARMIMYPNGAPSWRYVLRNDCLELKLVSRLRMPMIARATLQSSYLWEIGDPQQAIREVQIFLIKMLGEHLDLQAGQIDLCVDTVGLTFPTEWEQVFLSRARAKRPFGESQKDQAYYRGRSLETILFSGHGRPISGKIYNKVTEIEQQSKKRWMYDRWKAKGWDGEQAVWRVEFSLGREGLHQMNLEGIYETIRDVKRLWSHCTNEWLRMVQPGPTKNRARWGTHPDWTRLQDAFDEYGEKELDALGPLVRERKRQINIEQAVAAFGGYATTYAGWGEVLKIKSWEEMTEEECVNALFDLLKVEVTDYWKQRDMQVKDLIRMKKFLYSQKP